MYTFTRNKHCANRWEHLTNFKYSNPVFRSKDLHPFKTAFVDNSMKMWNVFALLCCFYPRISTERRTVMLRTVMPRERVQAELMISIVSPNFDESLTFFKNLTPPPQCNNKECSCKVCKYCMVSNSVVRKYFFVLQLDMHEG